MHTAVAASVPSAVPASAPWTPKPSATSGTVPPTTNSGRSALKAAKRAGRRSILKTFTVSRHSAPAAAENAAQRTSAAPEPCSSSSLAITGASTQHTAVPAVTIISVSATPVPSARLGAEVIVASESTSSPSPSEAPYTNMNVPCRLPVL